MTSLARIARDIRRRILGTDLEGERERREASAASERLQVEAQALDVAVRERIAQSDDPLWELVKEMRYPIAGRR